MSTIYDGGNDIYNGGGAGGGGSLDLEWVDITGDVVFNTSYFYVDTREVLYCEKLGMLHLYVGVKTRSSYSQSQGTQEAKLLEIPSYIKFKTIFCVEACPYNYPGYYDGAETGAMIANFPSIGSHGVRTKLDQIVNMAFYPQTTNFGCAEISFFALVDKV